MAESMHGPGTGPLEEAQSATRSRMEADMVSGRASQGAAAAGTEGETNDSDLSAVEIEETVITMVTSAFAGMDLQTTRVDVRKLEGGSVPTLRFTLDDMASTDLERTRVASGKESADDLASIVVGELRRQKGT